MPDGAKFPVEINAARLDDTQKPLTNVSYLFTLKESAEKAKSN